MASPVRSRIAIAVVAALTLVACSNQEAATPAAPAAVSVAAPAAPAGTAAPNTGKVLQLQQAGPYTYAEVETADSQKVWIAGGHLEAKAGDRIQWGKAEEMRNFSARTLGRTFDRILFVNAWGPEGGTAVPMAPHGNAAAPHPPMGAMPPAAPSAAPGAGANQGEVVSAASAGGYTYLEVRRGGENLWVAAPETTVKAGDKVSWDGGMVMQNFNAKSLNRVFDRIVFANTVTVQP